MADSDESDHDYVIIESNDYSIVESNDNEQLAMAATELMNTHLSIRQLPRVQALIDDHENLQSNLQAMDSTNPLIERLNSQQGANIDTVVNIVDSMRSIGRICESLQRESLSQETVEVVNTEGRNVIDNLLNICSRTESELHQNSLVLRQTIEENENTINDPLIQQLVQEQLRITANISRDPREAIQQVRRVVTIDNQLQQQIERVEPNPRATVRIVAQTNSRYLKYVFGVLFLAASGVVLCAGIPHLMPIVATAVNTGSPASGAAIAIIPTILAARKR